ncbi:hypothetical protein [Blastococcus sp. Marseille-P5729]|uniref:hypothetical protein n=1 Tax=Blastococcus sp. Marseille-P5729 TaxID=2086582 RepID=UPI00131E47FE|nr:hypothetical protein [Blastococcus sp. Marseille-P5729]
MRPHEPTPTPPTPEPKPPATGADAWKNQPTSCWPTAEQMEQERERGAGKPVLAREDDADPAPDDARPAISQDPEVPERFRQTIARLDDVAGRPVAEHAAAYDAVHQDLRQSLDDVDQSR